MLSVHYHDKKTIKQQSNKNKKKSTSKKPVKVVYISNPMKVKTSASQFSAIVQELTGQDAYVPDASKYSSGFEGVDIGGGSHQLEVPDSTATMKLVADHDDEAAATLDEVPENVCPTSTYENKKGYNNIETFHGFDDNVEMMSPQMLENNFPGFEPSKLLWYEN